MILPKDSEILAIKELDIAGFMEPAEEVGGDYYDVLTHHGQVKIAIGDVTGHGLESGVLMMMAQTAVRALLENDETNQKKLLTAVNRTLYKNVERMTSEKTMTLCLLDYQDQKLLVSGQHEDIILVKNGGFLELVSTIDLGFPMALEKDISDWIDSTEIPLNSGDVVVLYTDGITEAENHARKLYGLERLCEIVQQNWQLSALGIQEAVIKDVKRHIGSHIVYDDITLVVIKQK
jgi:sigma-B regulation protein RsbU (phosphoserine phosphatase)